nr:hypothetical protein [Sporosalibacterium faouarense]
MLQSKLGIDLSYEKGNRKSKSTNKRRNGYSEKIVKAKFGEK